MAVAEFPENAMKDHLKFVQQRVAKHREKLLDLTKRNSLISFRHSTRSNQHVRVIDELPDTLYNKLSDGRELKFRALPEDEQGVFDSLNHEDIAQQHGIDPGYELPRSGSVQNTRRKFIQTLLKPAEMARKLRGLESSIRSDREERGINTLYAAFGFLEWYEAPSTDQSCFSPLLLVKLEIKKEQSPTGPIYQVSGAGEEPEINPSFSEFLKRDYDIKLPELLEEEGPEDYFIKVSELIKKAIHIPKKEAWRVRRFITIGRFHFAQLVMYHDLNDDLTNVSNHTIVQNLLAGSERQSDSYDAEDYDIDTPEVQKTVPLLITSADASQHSALVDVMSGKNLAIKGPPGTGKSQTITNIIANALATGKTILFLAEKMAALNVVYARLKDANLDPYCLELHSNKTKKTEVLQSIKQRLGLRSSVHNSENLDSKIDAFQDYKDRISKYLDLLHSKFGRLNKTVYEYLWGAQKYRNDLGDLHLRVDPISLPFEQVDLSDGEISKHKDDLENIAELKKRVDNESDHGTHPWSFVGDHELDTSQQNDLRQRIQNWKIHLEKTQVVLNNFSKRFDITLVPSSEKLQDFLSVSEKLTHTQVHALDQNLIIGLGNMKKAEALVHFVKNIHTYHSAQEEICYLKDVPSSIQQIENIEQSAKVAKELGVNTLSASEIRAECDTTDGHYHMLERFMSFGKKIELDPNEAIDKIDALTDIPKYITSVPREYLHLRNREVVDATHTRRLTAAADTQKRMRKQESEYDLSMMGQPHDIRRHALHLENSTFLSFLSASYRRSKKFYALASKHKQTFHPGKASQKLRDIANLKEEWQNITQDTQFQTICGSSFNGSRTDVETLWKINEWADSIRKRYTSGDENMCQFLLYADIEALDEVQNLANDETFTTFKKSVTSDASSNISIKEYQARLSQKVDKLRHILNILEEISNSDTVTFADITKDLLPLQKAKSAKDAAEKDNTVQSLFVYYDGVDTDTQNVEKTTEFVRDCLTIPELKESFGKFLSKEFKIRWQNFIQDRLALKEQYESVRKQAEQAQTDLAVIENWEACTYPDLIESLTNIIDTPLDNWVELQRRLATASQDIKGELLSVYEKEVLDFETLPKAFEYMIYSLIIKQVDRKHKLFDKKGLDMQQARKRIKELDKNIRDMQRDKLCNTLAKVKPLDGNGTGPRGSWTERNLLDNETQKKKRHIPIRNLMKRAGKSIQKIKPCFLMSPLSVAQYLAPGDFSFDLVVIDEASQMRPENALGSVARARQIVVVGDPEQLPPTSFFQSSDHDEEEEQDYIGESIMDMALTSFRPPRTLSRHYRSKHESLIEFSNEHFYDGKLIIAPSPVTNPDELGVRCEYIEGTYADRKNEEEKEAVVKAALKFMQEYPERSLGIATLNQPQMELILEAMDMAFGKYEYAREYRARWKDTLEPFFVKNLENVQGDERDAIFISTVYGPDKRSGKVMQRFGPINRADGYRRLNVLLTRAKTNMVVFTSLRSEDIVDSESKGIKALKDFLSYISTGMIDSGGKTYEEPDSDFEICVKEGVERLGCEVHPQVGVAGYRIDLGIKHPKYPHGYLMGIECDGATYHSSKSARERDIIRQQHLESLGWTIHRIWSTDWFSNPDEECKKLKKRITDLLQT